MVFLMLLLELKLTIKPFTGHKRWGLLIQMQNISLQSSGMRKKKNFKIVFLVLSSPLFSLFLPNFFISFVGHLVGFIFKILETDERKGRWVVEQDFQVNVTWFFAVFSGVLG